MTNFFEKARSGRTDALVTNQNKPKDAIAAIPLVVEFKSSRRCDPMPFISNRAPDQQANWLH